MVKSNPWKRAHFFPGDDMKKANHAGGMPAGWAWQTAISATMRLFLLFTATFLLGACGNGNDRSREKTPEIEKPEHAFVDPASKRDALIAWTTLDPLNPAARAVEELITQHNIRNPDVNVTLLFVSAADFDRRIARLEREDLPPDLFIVEDRRALEMAGAGLLLSLDPFLTEAEIRREDVYSAAWRALETENQLWGLPLCAQMRLLLVNLDRMRESGLTTNSLLAVPEEEANWERFLQGGVLKIEKDFAYLLELAERPGGVAFEWAAFTQAGEWKIARDSIEFLALAVSRQTRRSAEEMFPFWRASQSPAMAFLFRTKGRRVPILAQDEKTRSFLKSVSIRGPWLDAFGSESLLMMPEILP